MIRRLHTFRRTFIIVAFLGKVGRGMEAYPVLWAPFGIGGASGATGYLRFLLESQEVGDASLRHEAKGASN